MRHLTSKPLPPLQSPLSVAPDYTSYMAECKNWRVRAARDLIRNAFALVGAGDHCDARFNAGRCKDRGGQGARRVCCVVVTSCRLPGK